MSPKATIHKAELSVSDMDRGYYATHALVIARHPSETDERMMVRVLAFALFADERLEFGRGLSSDDEPDLWRKALDGEIEQMILLGQPDEANIRKACGRSRQVVVIGYSGRGAGIWWDRVGDGLARSKNLTVLDIPFESVAELAALAERNMVLQCLVSDGDVQLIGEKATVAIVPVVRMAPAPAASR